MGVVTVSHDPPAASAADPDRAWRFGVVGWPVAHSRGPLMYRAGTADHGLGHWTFDTLPMDVDGIDAGIRALPVDGFGGVNITIPHKQIATRSCDVLTDAAREIGAVSLITTLEDGGLHGDNVDAPAFLGAVDSDLAGRTAIVLGAGGSARSAAWALRQAGCASVAVWNRTAYRARALAAALELDAVDRPVAADLLVNCTSVGLHDPERTFDELPLSADDLGDYRRVVDFVYRNDGTPLLRAAANAGADTVDGLSTLACGGAYSLERWSRRPSPNALMERAVREG
jgi:shikimate dehydrogenase